MITHLFDWLTIVGLALYYLVIGRAIKPFHRQFDVTNPAISHPYGSEQVPNILLAVLAIILPFLAVIGVTVVKNRSRNKATILNNVHTLVVAFLVSLVLNGVVIDFLKKTIGNHRPDFLARCVPDAAVHTVNGLLSIEHCTNPFGDAVLYEGIKSTPSGHSSISFGDMLFLTLVLWTSFKIDQMWKKVLLAVPLAIATYIAVTRTQDYRHHYFDIVFGGVLGSLISWFTFWHYFKPAKLLKDDVYGAVSDQASFDSSSPLSV